MRRATKTRVTISLSKELLDHIDEGAASTPGHSRSAFIESCLRQLMRRRAEKKLERDTIAYYTAMSEAEEVENHALASALGSAARRIRVEDRPAPRKGRRGA